MYQSLLIGATTGYTVNSGGIGGYIGSVVEPQTGITAEGNTTATNGLIDQVRIFSKALLPSEVASLYYEKK